MAAERDAPKKARATRRAAGSAPRRTSPRKAAKPAPPAPPLSLPSVAGEGLRVAVVAGASEAALPVLRALDGEAERVEPVVVASPEEAAAALDRGAWDLVVAVDGAVGWGEHLSTLRDGRADVPVVLLVEQAVAVGDAGMADDVLPLSALADLPRVARRFRREAEARHARRRAEQALRESEERFAAFMDNGPTVAFLKDEDGRYVYVNELFLAQFGIDPEAWSDRTDFDLWPREVASERHRHDQVVLHHGHPTRTFESLPGPDRRHHTWLMSRFAVQAASGRTLLGGLGLDVTELKQAEAALQATQERLERVLSSSPTVLYAVDVEGTELALTWISRNVTALLGYSAEEAAEPAWWREQLHPDDREAAVSRQEQLFRDDHLTQEYRFRHKDGRYLWVRDDLRLRRDTYGAAVEGFGSWADITARREAEKVLQDAKAELETRVSERTAELRSAYERLQVELAERRRAEEASRHSEQRLKIVAQATNDAIWDWDLGTQAVWWNQGVQTLFHYAPEEVGLDADWWMDKLHPGDRERVEESLREVLQSGGQSWTTEFRFRSAEGSHAFVLCRGSVVRDERGAAVRLIGSLLDITGRKRTEQALSDANDKLTAWVAELEQRNRELSLLGEMNELLQTCTAAEEAYEVVSHSAQQLFPGESGALYVFKAARNLLEDAASWGETRPAVQAFEPDECWALRRGRVHIVDGNSGLRCPHVKSEGEWPAYMCIPMMAQGEATGLLHLGSGGVGEIHEARRRFAQTVAENLALGLANLRLREALRSQAIRDPLTGLFNRRFMEEALEREVRRAQRRLTPLSVLMLDIDHFKRLNDTQGHDAGDAILRELGLYLQNRVRAADIACRYGGEEILLILPEAGLPDAVHRAEELRQGVQQICLQDRGRTIGPVTISVGVGCLPTHASNAEDLLRAADKALYQAKERGRDQVRVAGQ